jgi:hypothetical protein
MWYLSFLVGDLIRRVVLRFMVSFPTSAKDALFHDQGTDWTRLMMPKPSDTRIKTGLAAFIPSDQYRQRWALCPDMFPNLHHLDIQLLVRTNDIMGFRCYSKRLGTLVEAADMIEARLQAREVAVRVLCAGCRWWSRGWTHNGPLPPAIFDVT